MIQFDIKTSGAPEAIKSIEKLVELDDKLGGILGEWAKGTLDDDLYGMGNYAPPPANSKYIRTGRLGSNWGLRRNGKLSVIFGNATDYAGYVVGNNDGAGQAAIHAGRWWIARKKIEARVPELEAKVDRYIDELGRI